MTWTSILISIVAITVVAAAIAATYRRLRNAWLIAIVLVVSICVGAVSARKQYEGAEAQAHIAATHPESSLIGLSVVIVEWNVVRGAVAGSVAGLAALGPE